MDQKAVAPDLEPLRRAIKEQLAEEGVDVRIAVAPSANTGRKDLGESELLSRSTHVLRLRAIQHTTGRTADSVQWSIQVDQERTTDAVRAFAPIYKMTSVAPYCQKPVWGEEEGQVRCYKDWTKDVLETLRDKGFLKDESTTESRSNSASDFVAPNVDGAG